MLTCSDWIAAYRRFTGVSEDEATGIGLTNMNIGRVLVLKKIGSYITQETYTASTIANQRDYLLPVRTNKLSNLLITVGSLNYSPEEITSPLKWHQLLTSTTVSSDRTTFYYIDRYRLSLFPKPASASNTISALVTLKEPDLSYTDEITGSVSATNASATVTGSNTNWSSTHIGWKIKMPDGMWYEVASVASATSLTLTQLYEGANTSGADYRLGQVSVIPEEGQLLPVYYAAMIYYVGVENDRKSAMYRGLYTGNPDVGDGILGLENEYKQRSTTQLMPGSAGGWAGKNPNNYPENIG